MQPDSSVKTSSLSWLHLSDFHFGKGSAWQQEVIWNHLLRDVLRSGEADPRRVDWVFLSGDIANSGKATEYAMAKQRFAKLAAELGHDPKTQWFIVPGNHDVDRGALTDLLKKRRKKLDAEEIGYILEDPIERARYAQPQSAFFAFAAELCGNEWSAQKPWQTEIREIAGLRVALYCLNSAWLCQDDADKNKIAIGEDQARQARALAENAKAQLQIALFHHPLADLREDDQAQVAGVLTGVEGCQFLVRGHLHQTDLCLRTTPDNACFELAAGAFWGERERPLALNLVTLDLAANRLSIEVWAYSQSNGGFWHPANHNYREMPDGRYLVEIPASWKLRPSVGGEGTKRIEIQWVPQAYRRTLLRRYGALDPLVHGELAVEMRLSRVYCPLDTSWRSIEEREAAQERKSGKGRSAKQDLEPGAGLEMAREERRALAELISGEERRYWVVVGEPGSGKSTFLAYSALSKLDNEGDAILPILLELKDFGSYLKDGSVDDGPCALLEWAGRKLGEYGLDLATLRGKIGQERVLWLLDGLDEIFAPETRLRAARAIASFVEVHGERDRVVVTTRPHALDQAGIRAALALRDNEALVLPLNEKGQDALLTRWFEVVKGKGFEDKAREEKERLQHAIKLHEHVGEMCGNPLLLTVIATLFHAGKTLPERRVELYQRAVSILLERRFGAHAGGSTEERDRMFNGLARAARCMHEQGHIREIEERELVRLLRSYIYGRDIISDEERMSLAGRVRKLGAHSGLLRGQGEPACYRFSHLGFQEYLAASSIAAEDDPFKALSASLDDGAWREVILLTAGSLCQSSGGGIGQRFFEQLHGWVGRGKGAIERLTLVVEAALGNLKQEFLERLRAEAVAELENPKAKTEPKQRLALGLALGKLGDPRLGMEKAERWVKVPAGIFLMGSEAKKNSQPIHRVSITHELWWSKYPVTNEEYAVFVKEGGYGEKRYWSEEGWAWQQQSEGEYQAWFQAFMAGNKEYEKYRAQLEEQFRPGTAPFYAADRRFNGRNQPVVGINWYEAEAYCKWLSERLEREKPEWWPSGAGVRLPSEGEWEYAARGEKSTSYPWGEEEPNPDLANYGENFGQSTPVGIYPKGKSPNGLWELSGNVWEWCGDYWDEGAYKARQDGVTNPTVTKKHEARCFRGGSWFRDPVPLAAPCRVWYRSWSRIRSIGFRCCAVPVPAEP